MCTTCGCSAKENGITITKMGAEGHHHHHHHDHNGHHHDGHHHHHDGHHHHHHDHGHHHHHHHDGVDIITLEKDILQKNQLKAEHNRGHFKALGIYAVNLVSSPGSGKTTFLETTIKQLKDEIPFSVIEGDQQTTNDAARIHALSVPALQINTGKGCHLDGDMIAQALEELKPVAHSVCMIENVGNLVCPALFDLGEKERIVIISVTEGEDKPLKYPDMFHSSQICIINKIDLLPHLNFDVEKLKENALKVNHHLRFFSVSATTGEGMEAWYDYLREQVKH